MTEPVKYLADPEVSPYIAEYGVIHIHIAKGEREPFFSPPLGLSGFILQTINSTGHFNTKIGDKDFITEDAVATGQVTIPIHGEFIGEVKSLLVFFQPLGMYRLFGTNMATMTDRSMPLIEFLGRKKADDLWGKLKADQNTLQQIEALNDFFRSITPAGNHTSQLERVLDYIHKKKGSVTIPELEVHGFYHRKTLERHFRKMVGLSPKEYARIYQFKCMINLIRNHPDITWAQLADQTGYYDSSHLSRYVNEYLQVSPNSIVKLDMNFIYYLLDK